MCVFTAGNISTAVVADVTVLDNRVVIDRLVLGRVVDDMRDRVVVDGLSDWNVVVVRVRRRRGRRGATAVGAATTVAASA